MYLDVLIVEDGEKILDVIEAYLKNDGFNTIRAVDGEEALEKFEIFSPDIVILDLMLPDISGEEVCKRIKKESNTPVIMLTAKSAEEDILNGFSLGCDDYVVKPFRPKELVARVNSVLKRTLGIDNMSELIFNDGELKINLKVGEVFKNDNLVTLTQSEYKILQTLATNPKITFTRNALISKLNDESAAFDRVIDTHIKNLRAKIEEKSREPKFIVTVYGVGYRFGGENENTK